eukprot:s2846_g3.t1
MNPHATVFVPGGYAFDTTRKPAPQTSTLPQVASTEEELCRVLKHLASEQVVAIDCEGADLSKGCWFLQQRQYGRLDHGRICLLQIGTLHGEAFAVDILELGERAFELGLRQLLESERPIKVVHDFRQDTDALWHQYGIQPRGLFDCQLCDVLLRRLAGHKTGYVQGSAKLLSAHGIVQGSVQGYGILTQEQKQAIHDRFSRDRHLWERRPLPEDMVEYALEDVKPMLQLQRLLLRQLVEYLGEQSSEESPRSHSGTNKRRVPSLWLGKNPAAMGVAIVQNDVVSPVAKTAEDVPSVSAIANAVGVSNNTAEDVKAARSIKKVVRTLTPLEREIESIEGLRKFSQKPPAEVSGRVSVLTPTTASRARFHEQLWQCFLDQTWPDKELVVVETYTQNQQPSKVFTKLVKAGEKRLKYLAIEVDENGDFTVGAKRNLTVLMSSGQYLVNFDDDDLYATVYVERMVNEIRQRSLVALTLSAWHNFFESRDRCGYSTPGCWEPEDHEEYEGILYGYGFSYVYLRALALSFPYPNLAFAEDAPFMLKLREKMGASRVGLKEDVEGLCLHIVHSTSSTPDPAVEAMLTEEELNGLVVSDSTACRLHLKRPWFRSLWTSC